ncbi:putative copper resistance protein D [Rhizobium mesoamericanum]|nr:putative copper resistance protein D [Rhizobium mesoamericanum]
MSQRLRCFNALAILLIIGTTATLLPLRAATIGGEGWADALSFPMLRSILSGTNIGQAWLAQASAAILLIASCLTTSRFKYQVRMVSAGLLLISLTISGHAAMNSGWLRAAHRLNDGLHLLSGGAWLGALVPVIVTYPMLRDARRHQDARSALMRFSTAGHVAVAVVIATGTINTILIVGSLQLDWHNTYQLLLSVKILIVFLLVALAIINRYVFVPRLARNPSLLPLKWATGAEIVLGSVLLGLVSVFGTLQPI